MSTVKYRDSLYISFFKGTQKTEFHKAAQPKLCFGIYDFVTVLYMFSMTEKWYKKKWVFYLSYQPKVEAKWPPVDKLLPLLWPYPQMYIRTKNMYIFNLFLIDMCFMIHL